MRRAWKAMGPPPRTMPHYWTAHRSSLTRSLSPSEAYLVVVGSPNDAPNDARNDLKRCQARWSHTCQAYLGRKDKPGTQDAPPLEALAPCSGNYRMYFDIVYVKDWAYLHFTTRVPKMRLYMHSHTCLCAYHKVYVYDIVATRQVLYLLRKQLMRMLGGFWCEFLLGMLSPHFWHGHHKRQIKDFRRNKFGRYFHKPFRCPKFRCPKHSDFFSTQKIAPKQPYLIHHVHLKLEIADDHEALVAWLFAGGCLWWLRLPGTKKIRETNVVGIHRHAVIQRFGHGFSRVSIFKRIDSMIQWLFLKDFIWVSMVFHVVSLLA